MIFQFIVFGCKAQTPIIPLSDYNYGSVRNAYYKDTQNFLDPFVGTWVYSNNGTILKVVLQKKIMFHENGVAQNFYTDFIIGEYQYIRNGTEILNTLSNLNVIHEEISEYNISGNIEDIHNTYPKCVECPNGEVRLVTYFNEPTRRNIESLDSQMIFRRFVENGTVKLKVWFVKIAGTTGYTTDGQPTTITDYSLPYGEYILIKQP